MKKVRDLLLKKSRPAVQAVGTLQKRALHAKVERTTGTRMRAPSYGDALGAPKGAKKASILRDLQRSTLI